MARRVSSSGAPADDPERLARQMEWERNMFDESAQGDPPRRGRR